MPTVKTSYRVFHQPLNRAVAIELDFDLVGLPKEIVIVLLIEALSTVEQLHHYLVNFPQTDQKDSKEVEFRGEVMFLVRSQHDVQGDRVGLLLFELR